jgi:hypothetical protein
MSDVFYVALIDGVESGLYVIQSKGRPSKKEALDLPTGDTYISYLHRSLQVNDSKKLLLGIAWTTKEAIRYSAAFPERLIIDNTQCGKTSIIDWYRSHYMQQHIYCSTGISSL